MSERILNFFNQYQTSCEKFNGGPIHIPKPDPKNGIPGKDILLMFINERPGRVGPGQSDLISFENPDPTAARFARLFKTLGVDRKNIFITNACIYYPLEKSYRDAPPNAEELEFSVSILKNQIERVNPKIIIPMGNTALRTLKKVFSKSSLHKFRLKTSIGMSIKDVRPYLIFPLYHTSNRAAITRKEAGQVEDWKHLERIIRNLA